MRLAALVTGTKYDESVANVPTFADLGRLEWRWRFNLARKKALARGSCLRDV